MRSGLRVNANIHSGLRALLETDAGCDATVDDEPSAPSPYPSRVEKRIPRSISVADFEEARYASWAEGFRNWQGLSQLESIFHLTLAYASKAREGSTAGCGYRRGQDNHERDFREVTRGGHDVHEHTP